MFEEGHIVMIVEGYRFLINPVIKIFKNMKVILKTKHRGGFWSKILN